MASSPAGTIYRGREGMWTWVAHRITGVLIFFFLFAHVVDTAMVRVSPEVYNETIELYKNPVVGVMEVGLVAAVLFHALNGLRIILFDFWPKLALKQKAFAYAELVLFMIGFTPAAYIMMKSAIEDSPFFS